MFAIEPIDDRIQLFIYKRLTGIGLESIDASAETPYPPFVIERWVALGGLLLCALGATPACSNSVAPSTTGASTGGASTGGSGTGGGSSCTPGASCFCGQSSGTVTCERGVEDCDCNCPALDTSDATSVEACGGEPFGTWRLVEFEIGKTDLVVTLNQVEVGRCDTMLERADQVAPQVVIELQDGGSTRQYAGGFAYTQSWSDDCVTDKASALRCSDDVWTGVSGCALDCDICRCEGNVSTRSDDGTWLRTETTLTLALWAGSVAYDYCVSGDRLALSAPSIHMVFERVYTFGVPAPCADRSSDQCESGSGCTLGVCEPGAGCMGRTSESCLTAQGCTWNAAACGGTGSTTCRAGCRPLPAAAEERSTAANSLVPDWRLHLRQQYVGLYRVLKLRAIGGGRVRRKREPSVTSMCVDDQFRVHRNRHGLRELRARDVRVRARLCARADPLRRLLRRRADCASWLRAFPTSRCFRRPDRWPRFRRGGV